MRFTFAPWSVIRGQSIKDQQKSARLPHMYRNIQIWRMQSRKFSGRSLKLYLKSLTEMLGLMAGTSKGKVKILGF